MKRIDLHAALFLISLTCVFATCSKNDATINNSQQPVTLQYNKGFLVTIGVDGIGQIDSVVIRYGPAQPVTSYSYIGVANGFVERPKHTWEIIPTGTNQWRIRYNDGRYLGYKPDIYNPNAKKFSVSMDQTPGDNNLFVMNKTDNKFYIQPAANKNVYLNTMPADVLPPISAHRSAAFVETKQMWFIMP